MTDNEIIKALECCAVTYDCPDCPFQSDCGNMATLSMVAVDLINRLQADKEALIAGQEPLQKCIAEKMAEIERLQKRRKPTQTSGFKIENGKVVFYVDLLGKYRHEFKDLDEVVEELNLMLQEAYQTDEIAGHLRALQERYKTVKSEAIKEFWEKAKQTREFRTCPYVYVVDGDNLVKEMAGDSE